VDVYSPDVLLAQAAELDEFWSLTHGAFTHILPLYDPEDFFPRLKEKVFDHRDDEFNELVISIIVGAQMEFIGKIRNALACGSTSNLAALAVEMTKYGAYIVGLAHRHLYTSSSVMFTESLSLPNRPQGYDALCKMVTSGGLSDPAEIARAADSFWEGIEAWAQEKGLAIHKNIDELLA
jgi:kanamycin nucleotidyltransferase